MNSSVQAYWNSGPCESGESPNETNPAVFFGPMRGSVMRESVRLCPSQNSGCQARCVITIASEQHPRLAGFLKEIKRRKLENLVMKARCVEASSREYT